MDSGKLDERIQIMKDLDAIRDETLDMESMCRRFSDYLTERLSLLEAHVMVRNSETRALENPAPDRPLSNEARDFMTRVEARQISEPFTEGSLAAHPIRVRGANLGMLLIRREAPPAEGETSLADSALSIVDSSIEHALATVELSNKNRELSAVFELDRIRDLHLPFDEMIDRVAQRLLELLPADQATVVLFDEANDVVDIRFPSTSGDDSFQQTDCLKGIRDLAYQSFELRGLISAERINEQIGSALCTPLILGDEILGAFVMLRHEKTPFLLTESRLLTAMASQIDTAIFESLQRKKIKSVFKRYVSQDVVEEMLRTGKNFLEGKRRVLSVLFSDLRGFTSASERLDTDTIVQMLNEHLTAMTEVVLANRGTLDKFIGDCVMAFWNAPIEEPEHAWLAVKTAIEMQARHAEVCKKWQARGLSSIPIGIGINTGEMFVGNIGGSRKSSYTVIGDHVNMASRLEGVAEGGQILITERTIETIRDIVTFTTLPPVTVKGKAEPIPIFNVVGLER